MESYQFIKQIGHGNYGEVWLVKCSKTRKKFVLKRFDLHHASKREQRAAYLEAKLLSTVKHPNIVTYLDTFYNSKGNLFIVMGYCECGDFYSFIKDRNGISFEEKEIINWFVQICMALKYLHDKGIMHRDLKTKNIFLTRSKLVKVGDLGIARVLKAAEEITTNFIGTPYYMSPEIFTGKPYNQKSDIWALGCCMYEIATLESAFMAQDMHALMQKVVKGKIPLIPNIYSEELSDIISSMLSPDPDLRPNATDLLLNDFVRKFIILFLKESPMKFSSLKCRSSKSSAPSLADGSRPVCNLPQYEDRNCEPLIFPKVDENITTESIRTVPDSNGNGDGNDNSQHHAHIKNGHIPILPKTNQNFKCFKSKAKTVDSMGNIPAILNHVTENKNINEIISPSPPVSSRSTPKINAQKLRSENSFNLLNNLSYTIKQSRLQNWKCLDDGQFPNLLKSKYNYGAHPPKSAEELYLNSERKEIPRRYTQSAQHASEIESCKEVSNHLPQIKTGKNERSASSRDANQLSLPVIENSSISSQGIDDKSPTWECTTKDDHFDKLLIKNIMEVNGAKQDNFTKPAMCHHRKEILKLNEVLNSTSVV